MFQETGFEGELRENVVYINRTAKMTKGGRVFHIVAWVVVGDGQGRVGIGRGKAKETPEAIAKARAQAIRNMKRVVIWHGTLPHPIEVKFEATRLLMKPAAPGTGIKAAQPVRAVLEAAGYQNAITKVYGGGSVVNMLKAAMKAVESLKDPHWVAEARGLPLKVIMRRFWDEKRKEAEDKAEEKSD